MASIISNLSATSRQLPGERSAISDSSPYEVVAIAGSMGAPNAIRRILAGLPAWFPATVLVVQHRTPAAQSITVDLLRRASPLPVVLAEEGDLPRPGRVHVMPADRDLVIGKAGTFERVVTGRLRLPADALFESVAACFGSRSAAVVLSGMNSDGAQGAVAIKRAGGCVVAQSRSSARCFTMPAATIATGCVDLVLPAERMAHLLVSVVGWPGARSLLHVPMSPWAMLD